MALGGFGPGLVRGAAAGTQGNSIYLQQLLQQLQAQGLQGQLQQQQQQQQGAGGAYDAISKLFGGGVPGPQQPMPMAPPPGQPSPVPQPAPGAAPPGGMAGAAPGGPPPGGAAPPSPARAVLQGQPPQPAPQPVPSPPPQSMDLQSLVKAVDTAMPNASPQAKMAALEKVSGLMNSQAQTQFLHMKQQFDMQMQVAKLTQTAQNQLQQSLDRNATIEQRRDAAQQHNETMRAIAELTASTRESVATKQTTSRERNVDVQQAGATARTELRGQQKASEADRAAALKEKLAAVKLTPEQQLLQGQLKSLTSRYNATVAAAGPNAPGAKAIETQIKQVNDRLEQSLQQPAAAPPAASAGTRPLPPPGLTNPLWSETNRQWLAGDGKVYDAQGKSVRDATPEEMTRYKAATTGPGSGSDEPPEGDQSGGGAGGPQVATVPRKVTVTPAMAERGNREVFRTAGKGKPSAYPMIEKLLRAKGGMGALDAGR